MCGHAIVQKSINNKTRKKRNLPDYTRKIYIIVPNHTIGSNRQGANLKRKHNAYHDESPDHWMSRRP